MWVPHPCIETECRADAFALDIVIAIKVHLTSGNRRDRCDFTLPALAFEPVVAHRTRPDNVHTTGPHNKVKPKLSLSLVAKSIPTSGVSWPE